ncbi:phosphopantothenoylcysteine decarboxylase [Streptococcus pacificus]|uniref:Phosphopantothenoylcysteine decarboxylase n=1 Tax=Streptococcus pacificus TaxID=2740577 RepID=A0ABS0ZHP3_9STRE|nr:phosphopantothenoylcysteine decarboxylase [Streptococcus pacificus]MBJ8325514.1 phosphopantothenoylcysteine decarboxylase [Streptococcus pacificus]
MPKGLYPTITLAITGSISAYKATDLVSQLKKRGYNVQVLMTEKATHFITPLTLQVLSSNPVHLDIMAEDDPRFVNHIQLGKQSDLFIVAPASANTIAKLANGLADNIVTGTALALPTNVPKLLAPAMNTKMYEHPITQKNLEILKEIDYREIPPKSSLLACGDVGKGALANLDDIITTVEEYFK